MIAIFLIALLIHILNSRNKANKAYRELKKHHEWLEGTVLSIGEAIIATDEKGIVTFSNYEAQKLFSLSEKQFLNKNFDDLLDLLRDQDGKNRNITLDIVLNKGSKFEFEGLSIIVSKDGKEYYVSGSITPVWGEMGDIVGTVSAIKDITELKRNEKKIYNMEYFDSITGLPNKMLFIDRLNIALANARRNGTKLAVILLDLDNFKTINDTLGHAFGDRILMQIAEKIKELLREADTVARFGGDEFIILQPALKDITDITRVADRILENFRTPWILEGREYYITASMGIAVYPNDGQDEGTLVKNADIAMYRAKDKGKNNYELFMESMNRKIIDKLNLENALRHAIGKEEFVLYYQPQVDIASGEIISVEALIRWNRKGVGLVQPLEFIPIAEESGLIIPLGEWVLKNACRQNVNWINSGFKPLTMAVNLSAKQFQQRDLVEMIERILYDTGMEPTLLELEITESTAMQDIDFTVDVLRKLREKGIRISLDDFGTGYSSLNYLKILPLDTLKIDKSFIHDIASNTNEEAIAKSVIGIAHKMNLMVVAEGVETNEQLEFLKDHMCDKVQGYLLSKPLPSDQLEKILKKNNEQMF